MVGYWIRDLKWEQDSLSVRRLWMAPKKEGSQKWQLLSCMGQGPIIRWCIFFTGFRAYFRSQLPTFLDYCYCFAKSHKSNSFCFKAIWAKPHQIQSPKSKAIEIRNTDAFCETYYSTITTLCSTLWIDCKNCRNRPNLCKLANIQQFFVIAWMFANLQSYKWNQIFPDCEHSLTYFCDTVHEKVNELFCHTFPKRPTNIWLLAFQFFINANARCFFIK